MSKRWVAAVAAVLFAGPVYAQGTVDPQCASAGNAGDACQKAIDLFQYMAPQLGVSITGGNVVLGQGGSLGGLGHFAFELKGNILQGSLPNVDAVGAQPGAAQSSAYTTKSQVLGLPAATLAVGLFKGIPLALTNVGGIDALVSATYIPKVDANNITVDPKTNVQLGYGVRVGLLQESLLVPGVGFSWIKRDLPKTTITGTSTSLGTNDTLMVRDLDEKTEAWRLTASKNLMVFSLAAGVGQDKYKSSTGVYASVNTPLASGSTTASVKQTLTRTNMFFDASMNLVAFKLTAEVGQVSGGTIDTFNTFDKAADKSRLYGSVGLRFGF